MENHRIFFFPSVADADDDFFDKAVEGAVLFAFNQGEVCTCPSRILVHESIYDKFMSKVIERTKAIKAGHPLAEDTMIGAQASNDQYEKILSYLQIGKEEGAEVLVGGTAHAFENGISGGYYIKPTIFKGHNKMRIFQEEIFGPVVCVTTFKTTEEAIEIANDSLYGLGAGVWTRDTHEMYQVPRAIQAGRVWVNCYHAYPAHAPFGGYKKSGFGRENHKMMLGHYRQTKKYADLLRQEKTRLLLVLFNHCHRGAGKSKTENALALCPCGFFILPMTKRVTISPEAEKVIENLKSRFGDLMFHQSGGCCDGFSPMCFEKGEFKTGDSDIRMGEIAGCEFFMSRDQFEYWQHTQLLIDVTPGRGASFSLEIPMGVRFIVRSRLFTEEEEASLEPV